MRKLGHRWKPDPMTAPIEVLAQATKARYVAILGLQAKLLSSMRLAEHQQYELRAQDVQCA